MQLNDAAIAGKRQVFSRGVKADGMHGPVFVK